MRVVLHAVVLVVALTCVACESDDDTQPVSGADDDAGDRDANKPSGGGRKGFGTFHSDGSVLQLDDAGRVIGRDGAVDPLLNGSGGSNGSGSGGSGGATGNGDGGMPITPAPEVPVDPGAHGPWAVGVRTLQVDLGSGRSMPAEVWYPAQAQSEVGKQLYTYEVADWLPPEARDMLPNDELPIPIPCNCYRDLPIDAEHGPYPVSIFVHAFGGARIEAMGIVEHWASRGFIVVAADHPALTLADGWAVLSGGTCSGSGVSEDGNRNRDVPAILHALADAPGDWSFLAGHSQLDNFAVSGRIGGAEFAAAMNGTPGMRLMMLWQNSIDGEPEGDVASVVYMTSKASSWYTDSFSTVMSAYDKTRKFGKTTILAGINKTASQSFTPYCEAKSAQGLDGEHLDVKYRFCGIVFGDILSRTDCKDGLLPQEQAEAIAQYVTTAALEETLKGKPPDVAWAGFKKDEWGDLLESR